MKNATSKRQSEHSDGVLVASRPRPPPPIYYDNPLRMEGRLINIHIVGK